MLTIATFIVYLHYDNARCCFNILWLSFWIELAMTMTYCTHSDSNYVSKTTKVFICEDYQYVVVVVVRIINLCLSQLISGNIPKSILKKAIGFLLRDS